MKINLFVFFTVLISGGLFSQQVNKDKAEIISKNFINYHQAQHHVTEITSLDGDSGRLAWIAELSPAGFILVSSSENLRPVPAYSFANCPTKKAEESKIFQTILKADLTARLAYPSANPVDRRKIRNEWEALLLGHKIKTDFEQWPPEGTTPTGGWIFENWTQGSPYNQMCPIDGNTHQRSLTGCPATAMAMILNCLMDIRGTQLSNDDDYYHSFGAGNQYWIDDDWQDYGFPHFDSLNWYLDSIQYIYQSYKQLNTGQIAALNFACGVAMKQVFSSSISGTYGIQQAAMGWQRFGFSESRLVYDSDTSLCADLAENIKNGWPAHLGLVDPPPTSVGHNVVVDGYNTDEYYHFNFGWGGNSNGWYTMPPTNIPYNLTVIEGIVLDIQGDNPHVGFFVPDELEKPTLELVWDINSEKVLIKSLHENPFKGKIRLFASDGQLMDYRPIILTPNAEEFYDLSNLSFGVYLLNVSDETKVNKTIKIIR
jgi:hypothetical protein